MKKKFISNDALAFRVWNELKPLLTKNGIKIIEEYKGKKMYVSKIPCKRWRVWTNKQTYEKGWIYAWHLIVIEYNYKCKKKEKEINKNERVFSRIN